MDGRNVNKYVEDGGNRNPNQFRRPFNPQQILQRDRNNNEDKKCIPLYK